MLHPRFITSRFFFPRWKLFLFLSSRSQTAHHRLERGEKSAGTLATQTTSLIIFFFSQSRDSGNPLIYIIILQSSQPITSRLNWQTTNNTTRSSTNQDNDQRLITSTYDSQFTWLWWGLPLRLSKRQSMSSQTVLLRTTLTQTIIIYRLILIYIAIMQFYNTFGRPASQNLTHSLLMTSRTSHRLRLLNS